MYISGQWYRLTAKPDTYPTADPIHSLDVSILQDNLLAPVLGIDDPRTDPRIDLWEAYGGWEPGRRGGRGRCHRGFLPVPHFHGSADDGGGQGTGDASQIHLV